MSSKQNGDDSSRVDAMISVVVESLAYRRKVLLRIALARLPRRVFMTVGRRSEAHLRRWLCDGAHDPCICACSDGGGYTAASLFARGLLGSQWDVVMLDSVLPHIDRIADYASAGGAASAHALDMVLVMTFEVVGLRHTCCQGR